MLYEMFQIQNKELPKQNKKKIQRFWVNPNYMCVQHQITCKSLKTQCKIVALNTQKIKFNDVKKKFVRSITVTSQTY